MEMTQSQRLAVPRDIAWDALNDIALLKQCIPGCESIEPDGENAYLLALTAAVGPVKARFKGRMELTDIVAPQSYTIRFDGQGGAAGFGKGTAQVSLQPDGDETVLCYAVQAQVGGKIAQIGSRLVDAAARKMADSFFGRLQSALAGEPEAAVTNQDGTPDSPGDAATPSNDADPASQKQEAKQKRSWTAWISKS